METRGEQDGFRALSLEGNENGRQTHTVRHAGLEGTDLRPKPTPYMAHGPLRYRLGLLPRRLDSLRRPFLGSSSTATKNNYYWFATATKNNYLINYSMPSKLFVRYGFWFWVLHPKNQKLNQRSEFRNCFFSKRRFSRTVKLKASLNLFFVIFG